MTKYIEKRDLENKELTSLPIRRGCSADGCGCMGYCRDIVGSVNREEYETFMKNYVSKEDFLSNKCLITQKELLNNLIGKTEDEAKVISFNAKYVIRTVRIDDNYILCTTDYRTDRINIEIDKNLVTNSYVG